MYTIILVTNTLFCLVLGGLYLLNPAVFAPSADPVLLLWVRSIGFSFIPIGILSLLMLWIKAKDVYLVGFTVLSLFHLGSTVGQVWFFLSNLSSFSYILAHGLLAGVMLFVVIRVSDKHRRVGDAP